MSSKHNTLDIVLHSFQQIKKENIIFTLYFLFKSYTATFSDSLILSAIIAINSELVGFPLLEFTV